MCDVKGDLCNEKLGKKNLSLRGRTLSHVCELCVVHIYLCAFPRGYPEPTGGPYYPIAKYFVALRVTAFVKNVQLNPAPGSVMLGYEFITDKTT